MGQRQRQFISGVAYTAVAKYAGMFIQLGVAGVLARLLSPEVFGVVAVATVLIIFFSTLSDMGLGPAIVQHKELERRDIENLFCFSTWVGAALSLLFFASSWWIGRFYDSQQLVSICQVLSMQLFFVSVGVVPNALILKDKRFRFLAVRTLGAQLASGVMAVLLAWRLPPEYKIYALTVQPVVSSLIVLIVGLAAYPMRLRMTMGIVSLRKVFRYSAYQFLFNFINYFSRNLDKLLVGRYLNMAQLGYYEKSYRLMMLPLQNITNVLSPVMHPVFSEMQNDRHSMLKNYLRVVRWLALTGFPLSVVLFFGAGELMLLIFGPQWEPSVPAFRILSLSVGVQIILSSSGSIFQAAGETKTLFMVGLASTFTSVAGLLVALLGFGTIEAVAWGVVASFTVNFFICYVTIYRVTFRLPMYWFWKQFVSPLIISAMLAGALWGVSALTEGINMILSLGAKCAAAAAVWLAYVQFTGESDIISRVKGILRR